MDTSGVRLKEISGGKVDLFDDREDGVLLRRRGRCGRRGEAVL